MNKFKTQDKVRVIDELERINFERSRTGVVIATDCPDCAQDEIVIRLDKGGLKRFKLDQLIRID